MSAEAETGRVCPLEGVYDALAPPGELARCYSYLNVGCDVISVIDVINTCSRTPGDCHLDHFLASSSVGKGSSYSIAERRVQELIPVLGSQHAGDVSHKPGGRLPLLSARPAVTLATLERAATSFAAW